MYSSKGMRPSHHTARSVSPHMTSGLPPTRRSKTYTSEARLMTDTSDSNSDYESGDSRHSQPGGRRRAGRELSRRSPVHSGSLKKRLHQHYEEQQKRAENSACVRQCFQAMEIYLNSCEASGHASNLPWSVLLFIFLLACILLICVQLLLPWVWAVSSYWEMPATSGKSSAGIPIWYIVSSWLLIVEVESYENLTCSCTSSLLSILLHTGTWNVGFIPV